MAIPEPDLWRREVKQNKSSSKPEERFRRARGDLLVQGRDGIVTVCGQEVASVPKEFAEACSGLRLEDGRHPTVRRLR
jgi:hypothetical protein